MFSIGLKITPQAIPTNLTFTDASTGDEAVTSANIVVTKINLESITYSFSSPFTLGIFFLDLNILDKDYAINLVYNVVTNGGTYSKTYEFVTLGYSNLIKKNREFIFDKDLSLQDKEQFKKETLDINYFRMVAKDRCRFSDLVGAQKALDYVQDMNLGVNFSLCSTGC